MAEAPPSEPFATEAEFLRLLHEVRYVGGVAASGPTSAYGGNTFYRDALQMMDDTLDKLPHLSRGLFSTLPQLQGTSENELTNELPDMLPHQYFRQFIQGNEIHEQHTQHAEYWAEKWRIPMQESPQLGKWFVVYNSSDATPRYLSALSKYCRTHTDDVLGDTFIHSPTGEKRTVADAAIRCADFITSQIVDSEDRGLGLYAVPSTNPRQTSPSGVLRDGFDSYYYPDNEGGKAVDHSYVAYVENQSLAYDALLSAAQIFPHHENTSRWLHTAQELRARALSKFWMESSETFAAAIDKSGNQIQLESTAALETLNSGFLHGIENGPDIVRCLARWLYSPDVMTPVGPRMLHAKHGKYEGEYYAYQGSGAVWANVNGYIARGLRDSWQLYEPSHDLGVKRLLGWMEKAGAAVELAYVDRVTNEPLYNPRGRVVNELGAIAIAASDVAQPDQGWTITACLREIWDWKNGVPDSRPGSWQHSLGQELMEMAHDVQPAAALDTMAPLYVDLAKGTALKHARARDLGLVA